MSFVYLASPYTHHDLRIVEERAEAVADAVAGFLRKGKFVYSPIVHCHEIAKKYDMPKDFGFWKAYNFAMLSKASSLWVMRLPGWEASVGVCSEIEFAKSFGLPIYFVPAESISSSYEACGSGENLG